MLTLDIFGFRALWSPYFFIVMLAILAVYFLLTVKYRQRFSGSTPLSAKQAVLFTAAIILVYAVKGSPVDLMSHITFYAHMIQMSILYLIVPPLLIIGIPEWLWRKILAPASIQKVFRFLTKPLIALILFNGIFSIYHIPLIFDAVKTNMWLHGGYSILLFILAGLMWWPLVNKLEEYESLNGLKKVGYIFADGILLTPACALIIFADTPIYATFSDPRAWADAMHLCVPSATLASLNLSGPEMFNSMSALNDQQLGGVLMKVFQEVVYGVVLAQVFFQWYKKEQQETEAELKASRSLDPQIAE